MKGNTPLLQAKHLFDDDEFMPALVK